MADSAATAEATVAPGLEDSAVVEKYRTAAGIANGMSEKRRYTLSSPPYAFALQSFVLSNDHLYTLVQLVRLCTYNLSLEEKIA